MNKISFLNNNNLVLWLIFLVTLILVIISETTIVFPNFIMKTMGNNPDYFDINSFEPGAMAFPFLVGNGIFFAFLILHLKKRLPRKFSNLLKHVQNFEVSRNLSLLIISILIASFIIFTAGQLFTEETVEDYNSRIKPALENWTINNITKGFDVHLRYFLINTSMILFGNYRVIPYIGSISLLVLTFFFTKLITKSRLAGIISMMIVLQSGIYLIYNSSVAYDNFWALFYLLSLYLVYKVWPLSPVSFVASIFTKPLSIFFLPFELFFIYRSTITKKRKILLVLSFVGIIILGLVATFRFGAAPVFTPVNTIGLWSAFSSFAYQMRFDPVLIIFLLPITILLVLAARKRIAHADSIMLILMAAILSQPLTATITENASEPYRFIVLVDFFAIGVGILFSKNIISKEQATPNKP